MNWSSPLRGDLHVADFEIQTVSAKNLNMSLGKFSTEIYTEAGMYKS